jgi:hypothetical protein
LGPAASTQPSKQRRRVRAQEEGVCLIITTQTLSFTSPSPPVLLSLFSSAQHSTAHRRAAATTRALHAARTTPCLAASRRAAYSTASHVTRHTLLALVPAAAATATADQGRKPICLGAGRAADLIYSSPPSSSAGAFAASSSSTVGSMASSGSAASSATGGGRGGEKDAPSKLAPLPTYTLAQ